MLVKVIDPALESTNGLNTDHDTSAPGVDVAIVKEALDNGNYWVLDAVQVSYDALEDNGQLLVLDGEKTVFDVWITNNTASYNFYIAASPGNSLTILLKSEGESIAKLNTQCHVESGF